RLFRRSRHLWHPRREPYRVARCPGTEQGVRVGRGLSRDVSHWRLLGGDGSRGDLGGTAGPGEGSDRGAVLASGRVRPGAQRGLRRRVLKKVASRPRHLTLDFTTLRTCLRTFPLPVATTP